MHRLLLFIVILVAFAPVAPGALSGQSATGRVEGRVVDDSTEEPVEGVTVRVAGVDPSVTDHEGTFRIEGLSAGEHRIHFEHLAYGAHERVVDVDPGAPSILVARMSTQAIVLDRISVEGRSQLEQRRVQSGFSINEISAEQLEAASRTGVSFGEFIQGALPGVDVRVIGASYCVTYRAIRTDNNLGDCNGVSIVLDGVPVADPGYVYTSLPLRDIQRVEVLSPSQAGVRYGMRNGQGALVVETKRGPVRARRDVSRYLTGFDWSEEAEPYPWLEVFGASLAVNAAALGLAHLASDRCLQTEEASLAIRTRCGAVGTAGSGILSVALPAIGASLTARRFGTTERSRGRLFPAAVAGGIALSAGYILVLGGEGTSETAGAVVLGVGVPAVITLADRIIRIRR